jgi:hypothetical protein
MIKKWVALLIFGVIYCSLIVGAMIGNLGVEHEAYIGSMGMVLATILMTAVPFIIGIHIGVLNAREETHKTPSLWFPARNEREQPSSRITTEE